MNIVDALDHQARTQPHAVAFVTAGRAISYRETAERVRRVAAALHKAGIEAGQRVIVRLPNTPSHPVTCLALARVGAPVMLMGLDACYPLVSTLRLLFSGATVVSLPRSSLAAVVCAGALDEQGQLARCRARLGQKAPQRLVRLEGLPRNAAGTLQRQRLSAATQVTFADRRNGGAGAADST